MLRIPFRIFEYIFNVRVKFVILISSLAAVVYIVVSSKLMFSRCNYPIIMWWTPFTGEDDVVKKCNLNYCMFTNNRYYINDSKLQALLFYGSHIIPDDMPPRYPNHYNKIRPLWCLLHEESPRNVVLLQHSRALSLFNLSATFSRHSHFPLTLQHLPGIKSITGSKFLVSLSVKNQLQKSLAPIVYVQSDCDTASERDSYVLELMKFIPIDSYGACLKNKQLPEELRDASEGMNNDKFWHFLAQYKFIIAFENAVCEDYITEKLWRTLIVGSVPIYYGSPSVEDWLPNYNSIIKITDFDSPENLAKYIMTVNENDDLYTTYLSHKNGYISNSNLIKSLEARTWNVDQNDDFYSRNFVEEYECFACTKIHELLANSEYRWQVTHLHYSCPSPVSPLTRKENWENWWLQQWYQGQVEADVLHKYLVDGKQFKQKEFYDVVGKIIFQSNVSHRH